MLERLMSTATYRMPSYQYFNDRMTYIDFIDRNYEYQQVTVIPSEAHRFQGNLYGLFTELGVSSKLLPFALYLNGYTNPCDFDGNKVTWKIPKMPPIPEE